MNNTAFLPGYTKSSLPLSPVSIYQSSDPLNNRSNEKKGDHNFKRNNPASHSLEGIIKKAKGFPVIAFGNGVAAIDCITKSLKAGDEIIAVNYDYPDVFKCPEKHHQSFNIKYAVNAGIKTAITHRTKLLWFETAPNTTLKISDISSVARLQTLLNVSFSSIILLQLPPYSDYFRWELII